MEVVDKIYRINYKNCIYIGELSGSNAGKPPLQYHLKDCLSWLKGTPKGWENDIAQVANNIGWKEALKNVHGVWYISVEDAKNKIMSYMDKIATTYVGSPFYQDNSYQMGSLYNAYQQALYPVLRGGADIPILFVESLLICANGYQHSSLNYHFNTGRTFDIVNKYNLKSYFTAKTFQNFQDGVLEWMPRVYFTFKLQPIPKEVKKLLIKHYRQGIDIVFEEKFIEALSESKLVPAITDLTLKSLKSQLTRFQKALGARRNDPTAVSAIAELEKFINKVDKEYEVGTTTYAQLAKGVRDSFKKEVHLQGIQTTNIQVNGKLADTLLYFFQTFPVDSIFKKQMDWEDDIRDYIKGSMTTAIQKVIKTKLQYSSAYSITQHENFQANMQNGRQGVNKARAFLPATSAPYYSGQGDRQLTWIQTQLQADVMTLFKGNNYVQNHWGYGTRSDSIYGEQISIWLAKNGDTFYHQNIKSFMRQPLTAQDIRNY